MAVKVWTCFSLVSDIDSKGHFSIDGCFQTKFMKSKPFFVDVTFEKFLSQNDFTGTGTFEY